MPRGQYDRKKSKQKKARAVAIANEERLPTEKPTVSVRQFLQRNCQVRLSVTVPVDGVCLKMVRPHSTNPNFVMGTLILTKTGLLYMKNNAKKVPEREITWATLEKILTLGIA